MSGLISFILTFGSIVSGNEYVLIAAGLFAIAAEIDAFKLRMSPNKNKEVQDDVRN